MIRAQGFAEPRLVADFQEAKGLKIDGVIGPETMAAALQGAAPNPSGSASQPAIAKSKVTDGSGRLPDYVTRVLEFGDVDLDADVKRAIDMSGLEWTNSYRDRSSVWDFKSDPRFKEGVAQGRFTRDDLQRFGNFHFGYTARARGLSLPFSLWGSGFYQMFKDQYRGKEIPRQRYLDAMAASQAPLLALPWWLSPIEDEIAKWMTDKGFTWGDNEDDAPVIMDGWRAYGDAHP
jgi:hypothetical protein